MESQTMGKQYIWLYRFAAYVIDPSSINVCDIVHICEDNHWQGYTDNGVKIVLWNITLYEFLRLRNYDPENIRLTISKTHLDNRFTVEGENIEVEMAIDGSLRREFSFNLVDINTTIHLLDGFEFDFYDPRGAAVPDFIADGADYTFDEQNRLVIDNRTKTVLIGFPNRNCVIPEGIEEINDNAFSECDELTSVQFPHTLRVISNCSFANCNNLTKIDIPEGVTEIYWGAFANCKSLCEVSLPSTLKFIGEHAFAHCTSLQSINLSPDNQFFEVINNNDIVEKI